MLSVSCKAAIKAVVFLGSKFESNQKFSIKEVAEYINENEHTVGKLLQKLVKEKIINSSKGPKGGFYLISRQKNIRILQIIEAIDGKDVFKNCGLGFSKCSELRPCPFHNDFKPVRELYKNICFEKKVSDLFDDVNKGLVFLKG